MNRRVLRNLAMALLVGVTLAGCVKEYTITVVSNNDAWGTVTGTGTYAFGEEITITATPATGYYFQRWDDGVNTNPRIVTVEGTKIYTAVFASNDGGDTDPPGGGTDPTTVSGTINENTTWRDLGLAVDYVVSGTLYVDGNALLTIEPGVTIMFDGVNGGMQVGENAGISMVGTAQEPIVFTGPTNNPNNGSWNHIVIHSVRNDNRLEYVQILRGGSDDGNWRAPLEIQGKVHMKNCLIDGSLGNGLTTEYSGAFYSFENNTIKNCASYAWKTENNASLYSGIGDGNVFENNGKNMIWVNNSSVTLTDHVTLKKMPIPYYFPNGYSVNDAYRYTIEPGTVMLFGSNTRFDISSETTLKAEGTAAEPIVIRGLEDEAGYWNGIMWYSIKAASVMDYCQVSGSGYSESYGEACNLFLYDNARGTISNCTFSKSQYYGVGIDRVSDMENITHSNNTFSQCAEGNVWIEGGGEYNGTTYTDDQILPDLP